MHLFYIPAIDSHYSQLSEEESKHCVRVLRLTEGAEIKIVNGKGDLYTARVTEANPKKCGILIINHIPSLGARPFKIHVAVAPTKNLDRIEWFVEKAVEIGIDEISFLLCERSERKTINRERIEKIAVSAMKQSLKAYLPKLNDLQTYSTFLSSIKPQDTYIAHLEEHNRVSLSQVAPGQNTCVLIGPEGDFTANEIDLAYKYGIKPVTLGVSRLRTETAALIACHTLNLLHERNPAVPQL